MALAENDAIKVASVSKLDFTLIPEQKDKEIEVVMIPLSATWADLPKGMISYFTGLQMSHMFIYKTKTLPVSETYFVLQQQLKLNFI